MSERVRCPFCGDEFEATTTGDGRHVEAENYYHDHLARRHQDGQTVPPHVISTAGDETEVCP